MERPVEHREVRLLQPGHLLGLFARRVARRGLLRGGPHEPGREHRNDREGNEQRGDQRHAHSDSEGPEDLPGLAADQADREEHCHGGQRGAGDCTGHLPHGVDDRGASDLAVPLVSFDVLDHHDRVVDDSSDGHGERAEGEDVEGVAADEQADQRDQQRQRDRDGRDQCGSHRAEEDQDHQHGHDQADPALEGEVLDRLLNVGGLLEDQREGRVRAELCRQGLQQLRDPVRDRDGVGLCILGDGQGERSLAVHPRDARGFDRLLDDGGDVTQAHRTVRARNLQVGDLFGAGEGGAGLDVEVGRVGSNGARGDHGGVGTEELPDHRGVDAERLDLLLRVRDHDLALFLTAHRHVADTGDGLQRGRDDVIDLVGQLGEVLVGGECEDDDGDVVGATGEHAGFDDGRQGRERVDGGADLGGHVVGGHPVAPLGGHLGDAAGALRSHRSDALDRLHRRLDRLRYLGLDDVGRSAGVGAEDAGPRHVDGRDQLLLERPGRVHAESDREQAEQQHHSAVPKADPGQTKHGNPLSTVSTERRGHHRPHRLA